VTAEEAAKLSTEQLVEHVVKLKCLRRFTQSVNQSQMLSVFADNYPIMRKWIAALVELESREDAAQVMMSHHSRSASDNIWEKYEQSYDRGVIMVLMSLDVFREKMTPESASYFVDLELKGKALEVDTSLLANACLNVPFIRQALADAKTLEEVDAAYGKLLEQYPILEELEKRKDAINSMLYMCDQHRKQPKPLQRESAAALLSLERYYTRLSAEQRLLFAQYLLGYTDADGNS